MDDKIKERGISGNSLRREIKNLDSLVENSIYEQIKGLINNTYDLGPSGKFWWLGIRDALAGVSVNPKFYVRALSGKVKNYAQPFHLKAADYLDKKRRIPEFYNSTKIFENISKSDPLVVPTLIFLENVEDSNNPAFDIYERDLQEFKKLKYADSSDPEVKEKLKRISDRIVNRIKNTPEYQRYQYLSRRTKNFWEELERIPATKEYQSLAIRPYR